MLILKAIIWRALIIILTFFIAFFITKNFSFSLKILIIDTIIKTGLYFTYDLFWSKILLKINNRSK